MTDDQLQADVAAELLWDPKVDGEAIAVSAAAGTITLSGTVGSLREKREAEKAARRVYGVTGVDNDLRVRRMDDGSRDDAELRGDVLQALMLDSVIPTLPVVPCHIGRRHPHPAHPAKSLPRAVTAGMAVSREPRLG